MLIRACIKILVPLLGLLTANIAVAEDEDSAVSDDPTECVCPANFSSCQFICAGTNAPPPEFEGGTDVEIRNPFADLLRKQYETPEFYQKKMQFENNKSLNIQ